MGASGGSGEALVLGWSLELLWLVQLNDDVWSDREHTVGKKQG